ncbi:hypothetical protein BJX63DRAFT_439252 [Aspergillus granulosus]|uniref:F-box domain-containing protein n=1 Tax=Aspergillus granulosus TaxID=176169 RepID=A0ABR4GZQ0_9EURO
MEDNHIFNDLPLDVWLSIKDFLRPPDIENMFKTGSKIWTHIFKDTTWLEYALTFDNASPVLISHELSSFRPHKPLNQLYLALLVRDWTGDLRYERDKFFAALQDGWKWHKESFEISFPSGLVLNVRDVFVPAESISLPMHKIFLNKKGGVYSEYCYYTEKTIQALGPPDILAQAQQPRIGGLPRRDRKFEHPAYKGRMIKDGCYLILSREDQRKNCLIDPWKDDPDFLKRITFDYP